MQRLNLKKGKKKIDTRQQDEQTDRQTLHKTYRQTDTTQDRQTLHKTDR